MSMDRAIAAPFVGGRTTIARRILTTLQREALLVCVASVYVTVLLWRLAGSLQQDGWLAFVAGRHVFNNGIPTHEHLTVWSRGVEWVDQQWLAQLILYGSVALGGLELALFFHAALVAGTFVAVLALARWQGASVRATAWIAVPAVIPFVSGSWQLRAQSLAFPLFVAVLWLLIADRRNPSRRAYLVLPLLILWANIHGSIVLGSAVVALYGLTCAAGARRRGALFIAGGLLAPFVTPYGLGMVSYYRDTLFNSALSQFATEWQATTLQPLTAPFYALLVGGVWLLASRGQRVPLFLKLTFLLTGALALLAVRNLGWFGVAALVSLPLALDEVLPRRSGGFRRLDSALAAGSLAVVAVIVVPAWHQISTQRERDFRPAAAQVIAREAAADPSLRVFSDVRFADWLVWERPELAGRIQFDARFELISRSRLEELYLWTNQATTSWKDATHGSRIIVIDRALNWRNEAPIMREPGARRIYRNSEISVILRPKPGS
jgi:hypothetical protein